MNYDVMRERTCTCTSYDGRGQRTGDTPRDDTETRVHAETLE
jgi:hypothetical protein